VHEDLRRLVPSFRKPVSALIAIRRLGTDPHPTTSMPQLELFPIARPRHPYSIAFSPQISQVLTESAPVAIGVSGGKDSSAVAIRTIEYLQEIGHIGPRVLIHADLGRIEWKESLPLCQRLADRLELELIVVRRKAGDPIGRWQQRWSNNKTRYAELSCVRLIMPWSSASARFCTSELKIAVICQNLAARFPGKTILSVSGIRRAESASRAQAPVAREQPRLLRKTTQTSGWNWHPILDWSLDEVFAFLRKRNFPLHEAYTIYGASRVSCQYCILGALPDLRAAASCAANHAAYRQLVALEAESTFPFQPNRWLADVAPWLLNDSDHEAAARAKQRAKQREDAEAGIPESLLYEKGWPTRMPTWSEARLLAGIRREVSSLVLLPQTFTTPEQVLARYQELLSLKRETGRT
jgi:3'-phosphoadenosine 5'-phosphosulfate sulfotransferase (PAPS reductase)/FAD synthetase